MNVAITYNKPTQDAMEDELDILKEVNLVSGCLIELGHQPIELPVTLNLEETYRYLKALKPDLVFNLAESIGNYGALVYFVPALLDVLQIPYTGNPTVPMFLSAGKTLAKQKLFNAGLPVAGTWKPSEVSNLPVGKYILKPLWEEGSLGLDEDSVFQIPGKDTALIEKLPDSGYFIEPYIDGREFNVSLLAGGNDPQVLAVAEILFLDYPAEKPKVLGYKSKWDEDSFEFKNTQRTFDLGKSGDLIFRQLADISKKCWHTFDLRGYARVDFRMDENGHPFILEINANPCISPGSGFFAACEHAGIGFTQVVDRIIKDALKR
jgi:D-alanine-D-alanine ligase